MAPAWRDGLLIKLDLHPYHALPQGKEEPLMEPQSADACQLPFHSTCQILHPPLCTLIVHPQDAGQSEKVMHLDLQNVALVMITPKVYQTALRVTSHQD